MIAAIQNTAIEKFNEIKHKRWFKILAGLFIIRWTIRLAILAYILWAFLPEPAFFIELKAWSDFYNTGPCAASC